MSRWGGWFSTPTRWSALFCFRILDPEWRVALQRGVLLTSLETVRELAEVLRRPKFDRYLTVKRREELLSAAVTASEIIEVTSVVRDCRDAGDNKYLELAVDGRATTIVTGDADLLTLDPWKGVRIMSPAVFLESVR